MNRWRMLVLIVGLTCMAAPSRAQAAPGRPNCGCGTVPIPDGDERDSRWKPPVYLWLAAAAVMLGLAQGNDTNSPVPAPPAPRMTDLPSTVMPPAAQVIQPTAHIAVPTTPTAQRVPSADVSIPAESVPRVAAPLPPAVAASPRPDGLLAPLTASPLPLFALLGVISLFAGAMLLRQPPTKRLRAHRRRRWS